MAELYNLTVIMSAIEIIYTVLNDNKYNILELYISVLNIKEKTVAVFSLLNFTYTRGLSICVVKTNS